MDSNDAIREITEQPLLHGPFISAQEELEPGGRSTATELVAISVLYPIAVYIIRRIGLPWLGAVVELSDGQLAKFHAWVLERYKPYGFDQKRIKAAADKMYKELSSIKSPEGQKLWEGLRDKLGNGGSDKLL